MCNPLINKLSYLFVLLMITTFSVKSQSINNSNDLAGGWLKWPPEDENYVEEGSRNLYNDFREGGVYYTDNSKNLQVPLRYNLYNDEFEYLKNDTLYALENVIQLEKVVMDNQVFIFLAPRLETNVSGFVVRWNDDYPTIITKMRMGFYDKEIAPLGKPKRFERDPDKHYLMLSDMEIVRITSVNKLIKLLDSHSSALKRYAKAEKISGRNPAEMAKILEYYKSLGQDL